jgi:hypothetical protein
MPSCRRGCKQRQPRDASRKFVRDSLALLGSGKLDKEKLRSGHHKHISNSGNIISQILEEELVPLLLG